MKLKKPIIILGISLTIWALVSLMILWVQKQHNDTNPYNEIVTSLKSQLEMEQSTVWLHYSMLHDSFEQWKSTKQKLELAEHWQKTWSGEQVSYEVIPVAQGKEVVEKEESKSMRLVGHDGRSKPLPPVYWNTKADRFVNFVRYYAKWFDESVFVRAREQYGVAEELLACIARAETTLWNANKSTNNIMNYWNNDRGDVVHKDSVQQNVYYAAHWLTQGLLSNNTIIAELNWAGRYELGLPPCSQQGEYCYATSWPTGYWRVNVHNCLTFIEWENKDWDNYVFNPNHK